MALRLPHERIRAFRNGKDLLQADEMQYEAVFARGERFTTRQFQGIAETLSRLVNIEECFISFCELGEDVNKMKSLSKAMKHQKSITLLG